MKTLFCLLSLFSALTVNGKHSNSEYFVIFNISDCTECVSVLDNLKQFDNLKINYNFVFQERFKKDSIYIKDEFKINEFPASYIWSDSLYDELTISGTSSFTAISSCGTKKKIIPLMMFDQNMASYMKNLYKDTDTIYFEEDAFSNQRKSGIMSNNKYVYSNLLYKNKITVVDFLSKSSYDYLLEDSVIKNNFLMNFNSLEEYNDVKDINISGKNSFVDFSFYNDTLFTLTSHTYIDNQEDSTLRKFLAINKYYNENIIQSLIVERSMINMDYFPVSKFNYHNGVYYFSMYKDKQDDLENYFLGKYKENGTRVEFDSFLEINLPTAYEQIGYSYFNAFFNDNLFVLPLSDKIHNVETEDSISFNLFDNEILFKGFNYFNVYRSSTSFKVNDQFVWMLYFRKRNKHMNLVKYDRAKEKILYDLSIKNDYHFPFIDDFDHNYIYIPLDSKTLIRTNLSNQIKNYELN